MAQLSQSAKLLVALAQCALRCGDVACEQLDVGSAEGRAETASSREPSSSWRRRPLPRARAPRRSGPARDQATDPATAAGLEQEVVRRRVEQGDAKADPIVDRQRTRPGGEAEPADDLRLLPRSPAAAACSRARRSASSPRATGPPRGRGRARPGTATRDRAMAAPVQPGLGGERGQGLFDQPQVVLPAPTRSLRSLSATRSIRAASRAGAALRRGRSGR